MQATTAALILAVVFLCVVVACLGLLALYWLILLKHANIDLENTQKKNVNLTKRCTTYREFIRERNPVITDMQIVSENETRDDTEN